MSQPPDFRAKMCPKNFQLICEYIW